MTIKELADELGVSKQAIRKRVNQLDSKLVSITTNQPIDISVEGANQIREAFRASNSKGKKNKSDTNQGVNVGGNIGINVDAVQALIKQLEEKDKQIASLQEALINAQKLQGIAEQKIKLLEQKEGPAPTEDVKEEKTGWWRQIFR